MAGTHRDTAILLGLGSEAQAVSVATKEPVCGASSLQAPREQRGVLGSHFELVSPAYPFVLNKANGALALQILSPSQKQSEYYSSIYLTTKLTFQDPCP